MSITISISGAWAIVRVATRVDSSITTLLDSDTIFLAKTKKVCHIFFRKKKKLKATSAKHSHKRLVFTFDFVHLAHSLRFFKCYVLVL